MQQYWLNWMVDVCHFCMYIGGGNRWSDIFSECTISDKVNRSLKDEVEPAQLLLNLINLSSDVVQIEKYTMIGILQLYADNQELENFEICRLSMENSDTNLSCSLHSAKFVCSPAEVNTHRKITLDHNPQSQEIQQALAKLCEEYEDIFSIHLGDIGYTKLLTMDIDTEDYPPIAQKTLHIAIETWWIHEELEMLQKAVSISRTVFPWSSPNCYCAKESSTRWKPQKCLSVDYSALNSLVPPVVKAHSKAQGVFPTIPLPTINKLYVMLNGSTIYSLLYCTSGCHHVAFLTEAQQKSAFVTPFGKFNFKKVPLV